MKTIEAEKTARVDMLKGDIERVFNEAAIAEAVKAGDYDFELRRQLKQIAAALAAMW